jgi:preprotein translocase subunit SecG
MTFAFYALLTFFFVLCALFAGLILIQKGRGGGISSAFGGSGGNTAFGSKTGDVLTWATSIVFGIFLVCCVSLSLLAARIDAEQTGRGLVAPGTRGNAAVPMAIPTTQPGQGADAGQVATPSAKQPGQSTDTVPLNTPPTSQPDWVPNKIPAGEQK